MATTKKQLKELFKHNTEKSYKIYMRNDGDGWIDCYGISILLFIENLFIPDEIKNCYSKAMNKNCIILANFTGKNSLLAREENSNCSIRANKSFEKYKRWLHQILEIKTLKG